MSDSYGREGKKKGARGSVNNSARLASLGAKRGNADWAEVEAGWILAVITAATKAGGAVRFGLSRDGGAYSVGVYLEGDSNTLYCNGGDNVEAFLQQIYEFYQGAFDAQDAKQPPK